MATLTTLLAFKAKSLKNVANLALGAKLGPGLAPYMLLTAAGRTRTPTCTQADVAP